MIINYDTPQTSLRSDYVSPFDLKKPFVYLFFKYLYAWALRGFNITFNVLHVCLILEPDFCFRYVDIAESCQTIVTI